MQSDPLDNPSYHDDEVFCQGLFDGRLHLPLLRMRISAGRAAPVGIHFVKPVFHLNIAGSPVSCILVVPESPSHCRVPERLHAAVIELLCIVLLCYALLFTLLWYNV